MYEVCPHIRVSERDLDKVALKICRLPNRDMQHLLDCLPPDPLPESGGYILGSMRIAISRILRERHESATAQQEARRRIVSQWLPFVILATVLLVGLRRR
ncbi:hypothetical protein LCGC14_2672770 [marine sediment metagenome]|uniref:Uncharacterized protein n=1 Tax=marine sediment metagenome TaxID=412755 RepID=A0A0F9CFL0_9ZZZZ